MTGRERAASLSALSGTFGHFVVDRLRLAFGASPRHSLSADELWSAAPDSRLSAEATEEATTLQSTAMLNHGYRTWVFGAALARIDGVGLDLELFHAGALVHDVGLEHREEGRCFTYRSAEAAKAAADRAQTEADRTLAMMDGITMHISPKLECEESALGYYLQVGAMADLAGLRAWELPADLRARAARTYPREDAHEIISSCWRAEVAAVPGGRAHFAEKYGMFSKILRFFPVE